MIYSVTNNYYPDGYRIEDVNCVDLSIAHAVGTFCTEYYYDYCTIISLQNLFRITNEHKGFGSEQALNLLGFVFLPIENLGIEASDVCERIIDALSKKYPVILYTNYECLYYSDAYKQPDSNRHAILLTGYDTEKNIFMLQDPEAVERYLIQYTKGEIYYKVRIRKSMLIDIIESTIEHFHVNESLFQSKYLFYIKPSHVDATQKDMRGMLLDKLVSSMQKDLMLFTLPERCIELSTESEINRFIYYSRRPYLGGMRVIIDYVKRAKYYSIEESEYDELTAGLLSSIDIYISVLHKESVKKPLSIPKKQDKYEEKIRYNIDKLCDIIRLTKVS
jgi:hypothetical protein